MTENAKKRQPKKWTGTETGTKKRCHDAIALDRAGNRATATPVQNTDKKSPSQKSTSKKKKKKEGEINTPFTDQTQTKTPTSVGSGVKFLPNASLEKFSEAAEKKLANKPCVGNELEERQARSMVEENSNLMHLKVRKGMLPWLSEVSLGDDGNINFHRCQMNHNAISQDLSNEITNNFLDNPIRADLKGKVHGKNMGTDMLCFLTYNTKVSANTMLEIFTICKNFFVIFFLHFVKIILKFFYIL